VPTISFRPFLSLTCFCYSACNACTCVCWIQIHPFMDQVSMHNFPVDHAGKQETLLMMDFCLEGIDMKLYSQENWYAQSTKDANINYANQARKMILDGIKKVLTIN